MVLPSYIRSGECTDIQQYAITWQCLGSATGPGQGAASFHLSLLDVMILHKSRLRLAVGLVIAIVCLLLLCSTTWGDSFGSAFRWPPIFRHRTFHERVASIRTSDRFTHSKTLGVFSRIYVVSLSSRTDRRARMEQVAEALDIDVEYWSATEKNSDVITGLMERRRQRIQLNTSAVHTLDQTKSSSRKANAIWPSDVLANQENPLAFPLGMKFADLWELPASDPRSSTLADPLPAPPDPDDRPAIPCAGPEDALYVPQTPQEIANLPKWRILSRGMVACWHSHLSLLRKFAESRDDVTLILEDDVDIEFDFENSAPPGMALLAERLGHRVPRSLLVRGTNIPFCSSSPGHPPLLHAEMHTCICRIAPRRIPTCATSSSARVRIQPGLGSGVRVSHPTQEDQGILVSS
ncbi:hypothetical protein CALVIDRAFT_349656 [Calocera viscosa TUFC12733]|uniref:Glycosyl transferase family 25 domain-containing protein n=1 Tax=Calocera viscosa (strain TUFC12733) TaxID=1330018 RepID=A0A167QA06_CALVF|nr:hypothetical protein CALVIDRAFT_349656 [Calocera viscosa TUFC12733]